jgi:hypothetical protein
MNLVNSKILHLYRTLEILLLFISGQLHLKKRHPPIRGRCVPCGCDRKFLDHILARIRKDWSFWEKMEATIALQDLPPDMLGVILGFCEIYDLPNVARVCNNWRRVTMIPWVVDSMMQETAQASKSSSGLGYPFIDSSLFFFLLLPYSLLSSSWPFDSPLLRG